MDERVSAFFNNINGKKIAFNGCGRSNIPLTKMFARYGAEVTLCDAKEEKDLGPIAEELRSSGINFHCGKGYLENLNVDIVFRSPGIYFNKPELTNLRERGISVTSEMEVFFELCPCKIFAITGTDGKTTTTTIVSEMLKKAGKKVYVGGNIGKPLLPLIEEISASDVAVVELSSFQLQSMRRSPDIAAVTNIFPDHLNVHKNMEEYIDAKKNILLHQNAFSRAVLNMDNNDANALSGVVRGNLYQFSTQKQPKHGAFLDKDGWLCFTDNGTTEKIVHKDTIKIPGMHNIENYLCAICMLHGFIPNSAMADTADTFGGVEHRIEFVRELHGVRYYNDTIATSPASVKAGLYAFHQRMIVIAGGSDKQLDYNLLSKDLNERVKVLILLGQTADKIEAAVKGYSEYDPKNIKVIRVKSMQEAVEKAHMEAVEGDIVSLSPASASFDMFKDVEERGNIYKSLVNGLE